ncbi:MAG: pyridoxine 5'-phosphate synthase, partial [Bdellovibrionota bacterium]
MALLSVNVNKIATLRNARGGDVPNVVQCSKDILDFGAAGITVHPRPDERHIKFQDVRDIKKMLMAYNIEKGGLREFNIEGYPSPEFMALIA